MKKQYPMVGPVSEHGTLVGTPIQIGGHNDPCWVHLEDTDGTINICEIKRIDAIKMRKHLYEQSVRVSGIGRWHRDTDGNWIMRSFRISDFTPVRSEGTQASLDRLRTAYANSDWAKSADPLADLVEVGSKEPES